VEIECWVCLSGAYYAWAEVDVIASVKEVWIGHEADAFPFSFDVLASIDISFVGENSQYRCCGTDEIQTRILSTSIGRVYFRFLCFWQTTGIVLMIASRCLGVRRVED
jgi:hypothetical protein